MNVDYFIKGKAWLFILLFLMVGVTNARADVQLTDNLTLNGFLRETAVMSIGTANPSLEAYQASKGSGDKPDFNLLRTLLQLELTYQPTDIFRVYMKGRATHDHTYMWQSDLDRYNTTPWTYDHHGSDLKTGYDEDSYMLEIWEIWANIETDLWWIRLGKQQIAWGDLPGVRIADKINPLDKSWHLTNEPEEYENIRIPEWAARVYFTLPETWSGPFEEVFIDSFWNPGDVHPDIQPAPGSPYMNAYSGNPLNFQNPRGPGPPPAGIYPSGAPQPDPDFDLRGNDTWGARIGCNFAGLQATLNYMSVYNHFPFWDFEGAPVQTVPPFENWNMGTRYPKIHVWAMTASYAFDNPINTSITFEGSYTEDQPWQGVSATPGGPFIEEGRYYRTALYLERNVFLMNSMSRFFFPGKIGLMYYRHWIDNKDRENVKLTPASPPGTRLATDENQLDWAMDMIMLSYTLPFGEGAAWQINPSCFWNPEGAYKIKAFLKYSPNFSWRFDLGAMWQGGSSRRAFLPSGESTRWNDEMYFRITYSF
jgi:hypothetical protein